MATGDKEAKALRKLQKTFEKVYDQEQQAIRGQTDSHGLQGSPRNDSGVREDGQNTGKSQALGNLEGDVQKNTATEGGGVAHSITQIIGDSGKNYGIGVSLDSDLLTGLSDAERKQMVKLYVVEELAGKTFLAYDKNNKPVEISLARKNEKIHTSAGKRRDVINELYRKNIHSEIKQEAVVVADEIISTSAYDSSNPAIHDHDWLDNHGQNDWDKRTVYLQDKNKTVWEATMHIANSTDGRKILYDINPIKKVEGPGKSGPTTTDNSIAKSVGNVNQQNSLSQEGAVRNTGWGMTGEDVRLHSEEEVRGTESGLSDNAQEGHGQTDLPGQQSSPGNDSVVRENVPEMDFSLKQQIRDLEATVADREAFRYLPLTAALLMYLRATTKIP